MAKKKKIDIKQVIADALEHYHKRNSSIKDSTKRQNESLLSEFYRFVDTLPARDRTMKIFSQKGLNRYKEYLIDKMNSTKTDGKKRNFGVVQLNRCGLMIARLINKVLKPDEVVPNDVDWIKLEDPRREDQKGHIPLLDNEVTAIENCKGLTPVEEEYRDIFLLQIESGQRVSDLANILTGEYTLGQVDEYECIILATKKEDVPAAVVLTPKVRMLLERIKTHKHVGPKEFKDMADGKGNNKYNEAIRRITKKAGLDRIIVKIDTNKIVEKKPLYEVITSHDARSTFITNKIRAGMTPDDIAVFTGHVNGEMIRRVYAQPTIEDKLRNVKRFLSSDKNEKDSNSPTDTSSNQPTESELEDDVSAEIPKKKNNNANEMTTVLFNSNRPNDLKSYIIGLKDIVDTSIDKADDDNLVCNELLDQLKQRSIDIPSEEDKPRDRSKIKDLLKMPEDDFSILMEAVIVSLAERIKESKQANELGLSLLIGKLSSYYILQRRVTIFANLFNEIIPYIMYNRPIVNESLLVLIQSQKLNRIPDLTLVLRELQKVSGTKLEMIIIYTDCPRDVQIRLFNAIATGNLKDFSNTVHEFKRETSVLINYAYNLNYINNVVLNPSYNSEDSENICTEEGFGFYVDLLRLEEPFLEKRTEPFDISYPSFNKERLQSFWGKLFDFFQAILERANMSEKRILSKVLKQIEKYPELKDAYDEYQAKLKAVSNQTDVEATIVSEKAKEGYRKNDGSRVNYLPVNIQNLDIDKFIRLLTEKDELNKNQQFITVLESTDNVDVATCLNHFLGTTSNTPLSFTLKWNGRTKASLKFLIRLLTNTNEKASKSNVIDTSNREGISPEYVSQWAGSGELWAPVCNVFGGSTGYMMSVGLGDEGSKARKINLEQYNTIADIYFACKK